MGAALWVQSLSTSTPAGEMGGVHLKLRATQRLPPVCRFSDEMLSPVYNVIYDKNRRDKNLANLNLEDIATCCHRCDKDDSQLHIVLACIGRQWDLHIMDIVAQHKDPVVYRGYYHIATDCFKACLETY